MRTLRTLGVSLCLVAIWTVAARSQNQPPSQYEKLKALDAFVGQWAGDLTIPEVPQGARAIASARWSSNKSYLTLQFTMAAGENRTHMGTVLIGLNARTGKPHSWAFWPDNQGNGAATVKEDSVSVDAKGKTFDGKETSAKVLYEISGDKFTITVTDSKRGDEEEDDINITLERRRRRGNRGNN